MFYIVVQHIEHKEFIMVKPPKLFSTTLFAIVFVALMVSACAGQEAPTSTPTSEAQADMDYVKSQIEAAMEVPKFVFDGAPIDVSKAEGKTIFNLPTTSAVPMNELIHQTHKTVCDMLGINYIEYSNQGTPTEWAAGISQAINQQVDIIILTGAPNPKLLEPQLTQAKEAGIPVIVSHFYDVGSEFPDYVTAIVPVPFSKAGRLLADWTILDSGGTANILLITTDEFEDASLPLGDAFQDEIAQYCPECKVTKMDIRLSDWTTRMQTGVASALTEDPSIQYVVPIFDAMTQWAAPGVTSAGRSEDVKIATFNGTPFVLEMIQNGEIAAMEVGENMDWVAWSNIDQALRILTGLPPVDDEQFPLRVFTEANVDEAGVPPEYNVGYGDAYVDGYKEIWGLSP
jgi:ribose transport system substrate-binding protein